MPQEQALILHMHELLTYPGNQGIVTILILTQHGLVGETHVPLDLSFMADTLVLLSYFEAEGQVRNGVSVLKSRAGEHESTIPEYTLSSKTGVTAGEPLRTFQGVLSEVPRFVGKREALAEPSDDEQRR